VYLAVLATVVGQALLLGQPWLLSHAAAYRREVPSWLPRLRPAGDAEETSSE
jgi:hypothetical protein